MRPFDHVWGGGSATCALRMRCLAGIVVLPISTVLLCLLSISNRINELIWPSWIVRAHERGAIAGATAYSSQQFLVGRGAFHGSGHALHRHGACERIYECSDIKRVMSET